MSAYLREEKGVVAIVVAVFMVTAFALSALVIDVGSLYEERRHLQTVSDAAALAGAQELPDNTDEARIVAADYVSKNGRTIDPSTNIIISQTYVDNDTIKVTLRTPDSPLYFARIFGRETAEVGAEATAIVGSPTAYGQGVMPFGVMARDTTTTAPFGYIFGESIELKTPSQSGEAGNFFFVDVDDDDNGAQAITPNIEIGGVPNWVYVGQLYDTQTGVNGIIVSKALSEWITCSHVFSDVCVLNESGGVDFVDVGEVPRCHRVVVCPIIINPSYPEGDPLRYNWSGVTGNEIIQVIGFAYFFIEGWGGSGNDCWVSGRFIRVLTSDEMLLGAYNPEFGVKAVKLID